MQSDEPNDNNNPPSPLIGVTNDSSNSLDLLEIINRNKRPVLKNIPKGARAKCLTAFNNILINIINNPNDQNAWIKYFIFSFECLRKPTRGTKTSLTNFVSKNVDSFLLKEDFTQVNTPNVNTNKKSANPTSLLKNLVCEKIDSGNIKGAMRILLADDSIAPDNDETFTALLNKHPPIAVDRTNMENTATVAHSNYEIPHEVILGCLKGFPPDSSGGIDGLRPQHLKDMYLNATDPSTHTLNISPLGNFCNMALNGKLPDHIRCYFFGARLIALKKKDGGIRPIAVGSTIRRIVSKVACHMVRNNISSYLAPHQTGFGIKKGAEAAIHATRSYIEEKSDKAFLKIDFKNAFLTGNTEPLS
jgi:hypothetical protein